MVLVKLSELPSNCVNNAPDSSEQPQKTDKADFMLALEDSLETDRGSIFSSSLHKPLTGSQSNQGSLQPSKATGTKVFPLSEKSLTGKAGLAGGKASDQWLSIEHYLREQNKDTDPESLSHYKKSFYRRTWFACIVYGFLLLLLIAAILVIATNQAIIIRKSALNGQIQTAAPILLAIRSNTDERQVPISSFLTSLSTAPKTSNPTMDFSKGPSLISDVNTTTAPSDVSTLSSGKVKPAQLQTSTVPTPTSSAATPVVVLSSSQEGNSSQDSQSSWWNFLSWPGPLQLRVG